MQKIKTLGTATMVHASMLGSYTIEVGLVARTFRSDTNGSYRGYTVLYTDPVSEQEVLEFQPDWALSNVCLVGQEKTAEGATIMTSSGNYFDYKDPEGSKFTIYDIAAALSKICRYAGHCKRFYSVAEHSVYVFRILHELGYTEDEYGGLMHDAPEAFCIDVPSPLKALLPDYKAFEKKIEQAVLERFCVPALGPNVKWADLCMLGYEKEQIMPPTGPWPILEQLEMPNLDIRIQCYTPKEAEIFFLDTFNELIFKKPELREKLLQRGVI